MPDAESGSKPLPVVILSTADIGAPIWTNKQHIAARLVAEREVHYIESLGLRSPTLGLNDLRRIASRIWVLASGKHSYSSAGDTHHANVEKLHRHVPLVIPFHKYQPVRTLNRWLIKRRILPRLPKRFALWSFSPLTYGLEDYAEKVVYHSVDLLHTIDGIPREALLTSEQELITKADSVIASSKGVADHLRRQGADPLLWENVADITLFLKMRISEDQRERRAIFVGNLTPNKINFEILEAIVAMGLRIALAGPFTIDGTKHDPALARLLASPLVQYLGTLSQQEMAGEIGKSWVGLIPYHVNEYTAGVFPMKVYEYLSAGLPVVSTALPSIIDRDIPGVKLVPPARFAEAVSLALGCAYTAPPGDFNSNSWEARLVQIRTLLDTQQKHSSDRV